MLPALSEMLALLPEEEQPFAEMYLRHVVNILHHMPASQRFVEYAKAEMAIAHHAHLAERSSEKEQATLAEADPSISMTIPLRALPSRGNSR